LNKNRYWFYSLGLFLFLGLSASTAFAEVVTIQADGNLFYKDEQIKISGTVETDSTGIVTIVIRDQNDDFVLLTHSEIHHDDSFEKTIKVENQFTKNGSYSAKGFILDMTHAETINFDVSLDESPIRDDSESGKVTTGEMMNDGLVADDADDDKLTEPMEPIDNVSRAPFLDSGKDPRHYVERYYSEPHYKSWFDRNYPGQTIEETVGYGNSIDDVKSTVREIMDAEIIQEAQASSIIDPSEAITEDFDIAQISLAVAALGILFGTVYVVKRQADSNTRQIQLNRNVIRKKILNPILGSSPKEIIQKRLAKGEITIEEYDRLKLKLN
jgi:hypothetical protein